MMHYSHNAAKHLINNLLSRLDMSQAVLNWIQSPDVMICEHEADQVIDFTLANDSPALEAVEGHRFIPVVNNRLVRIFCRSARE